MTCVVGITHKGRTWIGADSCISDANTREADLNPKLWRSGVYLVGAAGNGAWFTVLRRVKLPPPAGVLIDLPRAIVTAASELGIELPAKEDSPADGCALIGCAGRLWYADSHLCITEHLETACGSGGEGARCVLAARKGPPGRRIMAALQAVAAVRWDVGPPFALDVA